MANSNTCAGADSSLPMEFLEEIRKVLRQQQTSGTKTNWEKRTNKTREFLDDHDCCLVEDIGGPPCPAGQCCCGTRVHYVDDDQRQHDITRTVSRRERKYR